ncbi:hypothetical protein N7493_009967 [Penicillium malachiteum]|uniref:Uncharacterized protein n=1 Tax=Penicillium malachiteum TaxID=1324776 RepID=A0AAD6HDT4_9EURO|nr:hypothetical protein N7493_009967 [Penicillium malachiteum]
MFTSLSCRMFDRENEDYVNFRSLLRHPGFKRLDLAINIAGQNLTDNDEDSYTSLKSNLLCRALSEAQELEHFSFRATTLPFSGIHPNDPTPFSLMGLFPIQKWTRLRHFGLSRYLVDEDDLVSLLQSLPSTIRSVELSFLSFHGGGTWYSVLQKMRSKLDWKRREFPPKLVIGADLRPPLPFLGVGLEAEVEAYLYGNGRMPFYGTEPPTKPYGIPAINGHTVFVYMGVC